jgi:hypothetical protein
MTSYIHDFVRRLLELHGLEERMAAVRRDPDELAMAAGPGIAGAAAAPSAARTP